MSKLMNDEIVALKHQLDTILDILIKNNLTTEEEFMGMLKERINGTLMDETEKSEILSLVNFSL